MEEQLERQGETRMVSFTAAYSDVDGSSYKLYRNSRRLSLPVKLSSRFRNTIQITYALSKSTCRALFRRNTGDRETWSKGYKVFIYSVSYLVGFGNILYLKKHLTNGRSAFFIPYFLFLVTISLPVLLTELSLGQFTSYGPTMCWDFAKLFQGVGFSMFVALLFLCIYYILYLSKALYYLFYITHSPIPWTFCSEDFTGKCKSFSEIKELNTTDESSIVYFNITPEYKYYNQQGGDRITSNEMDVSLLLSCLVAWIIVFILNMLHLEYRQNIMLLYCSLSSVMTLALFFRAITLDGALDGIEFLLSPDWEKLRSVETWLKAAQQVYFSLGLSFGVNICVASLNGFKHDFVKDAVLRIGVNTSATMMFAVIQISLYGAFAKRFQITVPALVGEIHEIEKEGISNTSSDYLFVQLLYMLEVVPVYRLWCAALLTLYASLGISVTFLSIKTSLISLTDLHKPFSAKTERLIILGTCVFFFLMGLPMFIAGDSYHVFDLMLDYSSGLNVPVVSILHMFSVGYVYGMDKFLDDIRCMIGDGPIFGVLPFTIFKTWYRCHVKYFTPAILFFVLVAAIYNNVFHSKHNIGYLVSGYLITAVCLAPIGIVPLVHFIRDKDGTFRDRLRHLVTPTEDWGPMRGEDRLGTSYIQRKDVYPTASVSEHDEMSIHEANTASPISDVSTEL